MYWPNLDNFCSPGNNKSYSWPDPSCYTCESSSDLSCYNTCESTQTVEKDNLEIDNLNLINKNESLKTINKILVDKNKILIEKKLVNDHKLENILLNELNKDSINFTSLSSDDFIKVLNNFKDKTNINELNNYGLKIATKVEVKSEKNMSNEGDSSEYDCKNSLNIEGKYTFFAN